MTNNQKMQLGILLIEKGILLKSQYDEALRYAEIKGREIEEYLVDYGYVMEDQIVDALAVLYGVERVDLRGITIPENIIELIPGHILRKYNMIPLGFSVTMERNGKTFTENMTVALRAEPKYCTGQLAGTAQIS